MSKSDLMRWKARCLVTKSPLRRIEELEQTVSPPPNGKPIRVVVFREGCGYRLSPGGRLLTNDEYQALKKAYTVVTIVYERRPMAPLGLDPRKDVPDDEQ